jgi:chromosomal replication initiation ATPase DnaA
MTETDLQLFIMNKAPYCVNELIRDICFHLGISRTALLSETRRSEVVLGRRIAIYFLYQYHGITLAKIGDILNRDHSTSHFHYNWMRDRIKELHFYPQENRIYKLINKNYE